MIDFEEFWSFLKGISVGRSFAFEGFVILDTGHPSMSHPTNIKVTIMSNTFKISHFMYTSNCIIVQVDMYSCKNCMMIHV